MKKVYALMAIAVISLTTTAQDIGYTGNFTLDNTDPCLISGSVELIYDDEANASYPNTGPFITYLKLVNVSNNDVDVPTTMMEGNGLNNSETKTYYFNDVDLPSQTNFVEGAVYRVEIQIDPGGQVYESNFMDPDTLSIGYTTCSPLGLGDLVITDAFAFLSADHSTVNIDCQGSAIAVIYDLTGAASKAPVKLTKGMNQIDVSSMPSGILFVKIITTEGVNVYQLLK